MLHRFASTAFVVGTLLSVATPGIGLARDHGGRNSYSGRSFSGGIRSYAPRGGRSFVSPRIGPRYYGRTYVAPRYYVRPAYPRYYGGGVYLGFSAPYGYSYDPGYAYDPGPALAYAPDQDYSY